MMEERQTYTYKKKNKQTVSIPKLILLIVAVAVIAVAAITGARMGTKKAEKESSAAAAKEAASRAAEASTVPVAKYSAGTYKVETGGYTLLIREQPSKSAGDKGEIPDNTGITITEISEDPEAADENYRYWGKTQYNGETGWVPMGYLELVSGESTSEEENVPN